MQPKWSSDSDAAVRTVYVPNSAIGSHVELKTSQASCGELHRSRQYNHGVWGPRKKACNGLPHFLQTHSRQKWSHQALLAKGSWQSLHSLLQSTLKSKSDYYLSIGHCFTALSQSPETTVLNGERSSKNWKFVRESRVHCEEKGNLTHWWVNHHPY